MESLAPVVLSSHFGDRHTMTLRYPEVFRHPLFLTKRECPDLFTRILRQNREKLLIRISTFSHDCIHAGSVQRNSKCYSRNSPHRRLLGGLLLSGMRVFSLYGPRELTRDQSRLCAVHNQVNKRLKKVRFLRVAPHNLTLIPV